MRWLRYSLLVLIPGLLLGASHATTVTPHSDGYLQQSAPASAACQNQNNADDTDVTVVEPSKTSVVLPEFIALEPRVATYSSIYPTAQARAPPASL